MKMYISFSKFLEVHRRIYSLFLLGFLVLTTVGQAQEPSDRSPEHPFLICNREQFSEFHDRAEREPWKTMAAKARRTVSSGLPEGNIRARGLSKFLGAAALVYILDRARRERGAERVRRGIMSLEDVEFDPEKRWRGTVPPMGTAFVAILALDIVYDDLTTEEIDACETLIEEKISNIDRTGAWLAARLGTLGTWRLYNDLNAGETKTFRDRYIEPFYRNYLRQMTPDGVTTVSPGYAFARLGSGDGRPQKTGFADVLEFTGVDNRYYDHPKLKKFYRWLMGHSVTPAREYHPFGDVGPSWDPPNSALLWRVGRFDRTAAAHAAWLLEEKEPPGHILSFVLMDAPLPEAKVPRSKLYMEGEAYFREPADSPMSASSALYNITENDEWHTHEEVNAISLAAYGNRLLVNGGWLGDRMRPPWKNNTITIDDRRHEQRTGAGLSEGLLADGFTYATGRSGDALGDVEFHRSLVQIHEKNDTPGYFLVFDEVNAPSGEWIKSYVHPACESDVKEVVPNQTYHAPIDHHADVEDVTMSVYFATGPDSVNRDVVESGNLDRSPNSGRHVRLESVYKNDSGGMNRMLTVFVPHYRGAPNISFSRLSEKEYSGARISYDSGPLDVAVVSDGKAVQELDGRRFRGRAMISRRRDGKHVFYFTRLARMFRDGRVGFRSNRPVTLFMRGKDGQVTAGAPVEVTISYPDVKEMHLDGKRVKSRNENRGSVTVDIPEGRHEIELVTERR